MAPVLPTLSPETRQSAVETYLPDMLAHRNYRRLAHTVNE